MLSIFSGLELLSDWLITSLYVITHIKQIISYVIFNEWYGPTIYETEFYKSLSFIKSELFTKLNNMSCTKNEILSTISSILLNFNHDASNFNLDQNKLVNIIPAGDISNNFVSGLFSSIILGTKASIMIFVFIWARASLPRIRFDQLMSFCWTVLLPIVVAFIILIPCILYGFDILPNNISLL